MLLLLDNLEQVVGAAPDIAALIEHCPRLLDVVATSRMPLRCRPRARISARSAGAARCVESGVDGIAPLAYPALAVFVE